MVQFENFEIRAVQITKTNSYRAVIAFLLMAASAVYLIQFNYYQVGSEVDDAQYVQLAQAIAQGHPYLLTTGPLRSWETRYPFGYPLILAPVYALFNGDFQPLKMVSLFFTLGNIFLVAIGWKHLGFPNREIGLVVAALYGLSQLAVRMSRMIMTEPAFTFFVLLGLILTFRLGQERQTSKAVSLGLGIVWMFAAYTRTIGIAMILASAAFLLWKRRTAALSISLSGLLLAIVAVLAFTSLEFKDVFNTAEYMNQFTHPSEFQRVGVATPLIQRAGQGILEYVHIHLRDSLVPVIGRPAVQNFLDRFGIGYLNWLFSISIFGLVAAGFVINLKQGILPAHIYVILFAAIISVWPWRGSRFLYGILPFLFFYLLAGGATLLRWLMNSFNNRTLIHRSSSVFAIGFIVILLSGHLISIMREESWTYHMRDLRIGATWIQNNTSPDSVIVAEYNDLVYLYARRATVEFVSNLSELDGLLLQHRPVYLMIAPRVDWSSDGELEMSANTQRILKQLDGSSLRHTLVFENDQAKVMIYFLKGETGSPGNQSLNSRLAFTTFNGIR